MPSPPPGVIYIGGMEAIGVRTASGGERGGNVNGGANRSRCAPGRSDKRQVRDPRKPAAQKQLVVEGLREPAAQKQWAEEARAQDWSAFERAQSS